jgi:hypothetical protein
MMQRISIKLFPDDQEPYEWNPNALVYGEWGMHLVNSIDDLAREMGYTWQISHIPTHAAVFMSKDRHALLLALRRLECISLPICLEFDKDDKPHIPPIPPEFVEVTYPQLANLDIRAICGGYLYRPEEVWPIFRRSLERKKAMR